MSDLQSILDRIGDPAGNRTDGWTLPCPCRGPEPVHPGDDAKPPQIRAYEDAMLAHTAHVALLSLDGDAFLALCVKGCDESEILSALDLEDVTIDAEEEPGDGAIPWEQRWTEASEDDFSRAELIVDYLRSLGHDVRWTAARGFYVYAGGVWTPDAETILMRLTAAAGKHIAARSARTFADAVKPDVPLTEGERDRLMGEARRIAKAAKACRNVSTMEATLQAMKAVSGVAIDASDFDANLDGLPVENGLVDLRDGSLRPLRRSDLVTYRLSTPYDPDAQAPRWEAFLREVIVKRDGTPDEETIAWLQRLIGYAITGHTSEQMLAVLHGDGANGKGVFVSTLTRVFAEITRTASFETFGVSRRSGGDASPDLARLAGTRLVFSSEGDDGLVLAEGLVKRLTGEDVMTARFLRRDVFEFTPRFLLVLVSNYLPTVRGQDHGIWRRIKVVPFRRKFSDADADPGLKDALLAEREGILAWAVKGAVAWNAEGRRLIDPDAVKGETRSYRDAQDEIAEWLAERVTVTGSPGHVLTGSALAADLTLWRAASGNRTPVRRNTLYADLERMADSAGFWKKPGRPGKDPVCFVGLRWPTTAEETGQAEPRLTALDGAAGKAETAEKA